MDVMRCWCPTVSAVVRCRRRIERADSGLHKPNWYRLSSRVATCNVLRTGWVGAPQMWLGIRARAARVPRRSNSSRPLYFTELYLYSYLVLMMAFRNLLRVDARSQLGRSTHPDPPAPPRLPATNTKVPRSASTATGARLESSSRPTPPRRPPAYSYALYSSSTHTITFARARAEGVAGRR